MIYYAILLLCFTLKKNKKINHSCLLVYVYVCASMDVDMGVCMHACILYV